MRSAAAHLVATQKPSGFLLYGFDFLEDREFEADTMSGENLTRQAFAGAALADYYALTGDARAGQAVGEMLEALRRHSLPIGKRPLQAVVESTRLLSAPILRYRIVSSLGALGLLYTTHGPGAVPSPDSDYAKAHAGAVALALVGELRYARRSDDKRFADQRQRWLDALIGLKMPGRGFRQTPASIDHNPFYDGEAWFALALHRRAFPDDARVRDALAEVDDDLLRLYAEGTRIEFFHWGTMAAAARFADTGQRRFLELVRTYVDAYLQRAVRREVQGNACSILEGMVDSLAALIAAGEGNSDLAAQARDWVARELRKTERLQIRTDQRELRFANANIRAPRLVEFAGAYRAGLFSTSTQVDFTAHCLSAMVKMARGGLLPETAGRRLP